MQEMRNIMAVKEPVLSSNNDGADGWIETYKHNYVNYIHKNDPKNFDIEDIAHSLSQLCRFNGHCVEFYSVAQHSCIVAHYVKKDLKLTALLHDAAEAYIGDIPRPVKGIIPVIKQLENSLMTQIAATFGIQYPFPNIIDLIDSRLLLAEGQQLFKKPVHWNIKDIDPLGYKFKTLWTSKEAEERFLDKFNEYWNYKE